MTASSACSTPAACSATGPPASCMVNACWRGIVSPSRTTPSLSSAMIWASCAPILWPNASAPAGAIGSPQDGVRLGALRSRSALVCSGRSSLHQSAFGPSAATIRARWKPHSAPLTTLSTIFAKRNLNLYAASYPPTGFRPPVPGPVGRRCRPPAALGRGFGCFTRLVTEPQRAPATKVTQSRTRVLNASALRAPASTSATEQPWRSSRSK